MDKSLFTQLSLGKQNNKHQSDNKQYNQSTNIRWMKSTYCFVYEPLAEPSGVQSRLPTGITRRRQCLTVCNEPQRGIINSTNIEQTHSYTKDLHNPKLSRKQQQLAAFFTLKEKHNTPKVKTHFSISLFTRFSTCGLKVKGSSIIIARYL